VKCTLRCGTLAQRGSGLLSTTLHLSMASSERSVHSFERSETRADFNADSYDRDSKENVRRQITSLLRAMQPGVIFVAIISFNKLISCCFRQKVLHCLARVVISVA